MGYYSMNQCRIVRDASTRTITVEVWDEELRQTLKDVFPYEELNRAFEWIKAKFNQLSM